MLCSTLPRWGRITVLAPGRSPMPWVVWPGCSSTALLSAPVTAVFAQAVMWGWHVPRDLSLLVLTPDALPVKEDCPRALARLCSHIYSPHLLTRMPMFPLETKWPWPLASRARYAAESKSEDYYFCIYCNGNQSELRLSFDTNYVWRMHFPGWLFLQSFLAWTFTCPPLANHWQMQVHVWHRGWTLGYKIQSREDRRYCFPHKIFLSFFLYPFRGGSDPTNFKSKLQFSWSTVVPDLLKQRHSILKAPGR